MSRRRLPTCRLLSAIILSSLTSTTYAAASDFSFYPSSAINCLDKADAISDCPDTLGAVRNSCLCANGGDFVVNVAKCVGAEASDVIPQVYKTMSEACLDSTTQLSVSQTDFYDLAENKKDNLEGTTTTSAAESTTSAAATETETGSATVTKDIATTDSATTDNATTGTTSSTSTASTSSAAADEDEDDHPLPLGAIAGIGAGIGVIAVAAAGGLITYLIRRRRKRSPEEANDMLLRDTAYQNQQNPNNLPPQHPHHLNHPYTHNAMSMNGLPMPGPAASTTFSQGEMSPNLNGTFNEQELKSARQWSSAVSNMSAPSPIWPHGGGYQSNNSSWGQLPGTIAELPQEGTPRVHEMDATQSFVAELDGNSPFDSKKAKS